GSSTGRPPPSAPRRSSRSTTWSSTSPATRRACAAASSTSRTRSSSSCASWPRTAAGFGPASSSWPRSGATATTAARAPSTSTSAACAPSSARSSAAWSRRCATWATRCAVREQERKSERAGGATVTWRTLEVEGDGDGPLRELTGDDSVGPPPSGRLRWIDLGAQDAAALDLLGKRFGFHPLTLEDCAQFDQRAKLEEYSSYLFVVMHGFSQPDEVAEVVPNELHAFLGHGYLVTVHAEAMPVLDAVWAR